MKKTILYLIALAVTALGTGCSRQFTTASYEEVGYQHQTLAILPFEMIFTGNLPRDLSPEMVEEIEESESLAFQVSMFNMLHRPSNLSRRPMRVTIQHFDETNRRLENEGISVRESWYMPAEALAQVLGVDAVVKTRVEKTRFISDLASYGIFVARDLLAEFPAYIPIPGSQTGQVLLTCSILDGGEGFPVWVYSDWEPAFWYQPADRVINGINRKAAERFPYREEVY